MILDMSGSSLYGNQGQTIGMGYLWTDTSDAAAAPISTGDNQGFVGYGTSKGIGSRGRSRERFWWPLSIEERLEEGV